MAGDFRIAEPVVTGMIDTNVVISLSALTGSDLPDEMMISSVTLAELSAGPAHAFDKLEWARRQSVLQHAEATFDPVPFDAACARSFGEVVAAVLAAGRTPRRRFADLLIAATAAANDVPLYTMNIGDFAGLESLVRVVGVRPPAEIGTA